MEERILMDENIDIEEINKAIAKLPSETLLQSARKLFVQSIILNIISEELMKNGTL